MKNEPQKTFWPAGEMNPQRKAVRKGMVKLARLLARFAQGDGPLIGGHHKPLKFSIAN